MKQMKYIFQFQLAELTAMADKIILLMERDLSMLSNRGVSPADIFNLRTKNDEMKVLIDDVSKHAEIMIKTEEKNEELELMLEMTRDVGSIIKLGLGANSPWYKGLKIGYLTQMGQIRQLATARKTVFAAQKNFQQLIEYGMTPVLIGQLQQQANTVEEAMQNKRETELERWLATQMRVEKANELYRLLQRYSQVGKSVWRNKNYAKMSQYMLYRGISAHNRRKREQKMASLEDNMTDGEGN